MDHWHMAAIGLDLRLMTTDSMLSVVEQHMHEKLTAEGRSWVRDQ